MRENTVEQGCLPFEILSLEQLDALILDIHNRYPRLKAAAARLPPGDITVWWKRPISTADSRA
ncbi:MAG: hypothetical protein ACLR0U_09370 [Enterocloster clostridioformis]